MKRVLLIAGILLLPLFLGGWGAPSISEEANWRVDWWVHYDEVRKDPQAYLGKTLLLGGSIASISAGREGTMMEVVCFPLGSHDRPEQKAVSCGHFWAKTTRTLDPDRFRPGRWITLIGTVLGPRPRAGKPPEQGAPLFQIVRLRLWPEPEPWPSYGYPPSYDPWCDSFYGPSWGPPYPPFCR